MLRVIRHTRVFAHFALLVMLGSVPVVPVVRDVQLNVGALQETVTVSADALLETSSTGSHVDLGAKTWTGRVKISF